MTEKLPEFSLCLPTAEDTAIFLKLRARNLWPIDRDFCDFAMLRVYWADGGAARDGANIFDWNQQFMESLQP